jgi:putative drug exporter of the RND superfamily
MATVLYRLGRLAFHRRWLVIGMWVVLLGFAGIGSQQLSGSTSETFSIPGTESQRAMDLLEKRTGASADTGTARVVFRAADGTTVDTAGRKRAIESAVTEMSGLPHVTSASDPFTTAAVAADGSTAVATVTYDVQAAELTKADQDQLFEAGDRAASAGLKVDYGGDAAQEKIGQSPAEGIGIAVAAVVLVITFGSLLAAGLPLITALIGVALGMMGVAIASGFTDVSSSTGTLATMLGLAVGIDYALFIVSRYRQELAAGHPRDEAAGRAVGTAGSAVVFAGATVVIALSALAVTEIPNITVMGLAAAGTVFVAVLIALTLLPALLSLMGNRIRGRRDDDTSGESGKPGRGERWGRFVVRRRVPLLVATVAVLGIVAIPATDLRLGMPSDATANPGTTQRAAYDAISDGFGPGTNGPRVVVADLTGSSDATGAVSDIEQRLAKVKGVASVTPGQIDKAGDTVIYTVIPTTGPEDEATVELVHALRDDASALKAATGATVFVTGATAVAIDVSDQLSSALLPYLIVVVGLALLLLLLVFRSILVPLKATAGFLLSVFATFGAVVAVFQWGWLADLLGVQTTGPVMSFLPIMLVGVLFGLAMDYEVFLVTRMREAFVHGAPDSIGLADSAIVHGFRHSSRVVVAAAIIMASVFAGFMFSSETIVKSMGFALAAGVLIDAFLIRMLVGPALMSLLGRRAWALPRWLDRVTPVVDVEGERLTRQLDTTEPRVLEPV